MAKTIPQLTDATAVSGADELIIHQSGITKRATATELLNGSGTVTSTGSTTGRTLADRFSETINAKDFGAVGDGVVDDAPAIQAAVTFCSENRRPLYVPDGTYRLASRVELNNTPAPYINMTGAGTNQTRFTVNGAENSLGAFYFFRNGPQLTAMVSDIAIVAIAQSGNCGTALHIEENQGGGAQNPSVRLTNLFIDSPDSVTSTNGVNDIATPAYWTRGVVVKNSPRPRLTNVIADNPKQRFSTDTQDNDDAELDALEDGTNTKFGVIFKDDSVDYLGDVGIDVSDCYSPILDSCGARHYKIGFYALSSARKVEGGRFTNCAAVAVKDGIRIDATTQRGVEPALSILGGHINYRDNGIYIRKRKQIHIERVLFYHTNPFQGQANYGQRSEDADGTAYDIRLQQTHDAKVVENRFRRKATSNRNAIRMTNWDAGGGRQPDLRVSNNSFDGRFAVAVRVDAVPSKQQFVEPEVGQNWFGFGVEQQIQLGAFFERAPYLQQLMTDRFTPSVVSGSLVNLTSVDTPQCFFTRVGNNVSAFGRFNINPTATGTACQFDIEPPILLTFPITDLVTNSEYTIRFVGGSNFGTVGVIPASFTGQVTGMSSDVTIKTDTAGSALAIGQAAPNGTAGNSIVLSFDGSTTINDSIAAWNSLNPLNTAVRVSGTGSQTPNNGQTITLSGGGPLTTNAVGDVFTAIGPNTANGSGGGLATRNTSLLSVDDGAGFIVHCGSGSSPNNAFGQVFPSEGKVRFRFLPHGTSSAFYYFNFSYELK
jgi:hypothetical protein